jgi:histidinol-phosphate aminotransferase
MDSMDKLKSSPVPRTAVAAPDLVRPDWRVGQPRDSKLLWLDKNENLDPELTAFLHGMIVDLAPAAASTYPDVAPLYRKLAASLGRAPENLLLTSGSDAAIASAFQTFVERGDRVLHASPTFAMYEVYCRIFGAEWHTVDYRRGTAGPVLDLGALRKAIIELRPRLVCLANPDSPTGTIVAQPDLRALIEEAAAVGALMLLDEVYYPFHPETGIGWVDEYPNLVVIRSASKCWGLAGVRVGYVAACPALAETLHKVKPMYEIGAFAAALFGRLLDHDDQMQASVARLLEGKRAFGDAMRGLGFEVLDCAGNFIHVAFGARAERIHRALADIVCYRADFGHEALKGYSRFSATTAAGFAPVIDRIRSVA